MSVPASTGKVQYILTSATQALAVPFYFIDNSHVRVVRTRSGVDVPIIGFTLTGAGNEDGGTLTLTGDGTAIGDRITIKRAVPLSQLVNYAPNDRFPASTHERALDKLTMLVQQMNEVSGRSLIYGEGEVVGAGNQIPNIVGRALKVLAFDDEGLVDVSLSLEALQRLIIYNPVDALPSVTDYGQISEAASSFADYGTIS